MTIHKSQGLTLDKVVQERAAKEQEKAAKKAEKQAEAAEKNKLYCICKQKFDKRYRWIGCDDPACEIEWFHAKCLSISSSTYDRLSALIRCGLDVSTVQLN